ncbi:unnamed protein product [Adineta steineri]|uniref:Elongator complex protein 2 n=1 Tax=Adineta steineri TaxID=433720 RepID=A0A815R0I1_9BILA|nr:unnamed protein product [Adineta steineri]CAF3573263.1 unnamed protein product [Adineta steineri]
MANISSDIKIGVDYISGGCNCGPHTLDWQNGPRLIYGVTNSVALCSDVAPFSVRKTFSGHQGRLNCVKWIRQEQQNSNSDYYFLSASVDKTIGVWKGKDENYTKHLSLDGHQNSVTTVSGYQQSSNDNIYVASGAADSTVKIWRINNTTATCLHTIDFKNGFAITLELVPLDSHKDMFLLFVATDKNKVHIYQVSDSVIELVFVLSGHEDWIRTITIQKTTPYQWFVATCSQDNYIRIWQLSFDVNNNHANIDSTILKLKRSSFTLNISNDLLINIDVELYSILLGHEEAIYGLCWYPNTNRKKPATTILSASMDKSMVLWTFDDNQKMYIDKARVGEIGGNTLGFYGCTFSPCGSYILGHGYEGALHLWKIEEVDDRINLIPQVINSGHFDTVEDCCWDKHSGRYLLSVSTDKTTRLHAEWKRNEIISWHEIGRPQIHGYEMKCLAFIGSNQQRVVSGADEKILRIFDAPKNFLENFARITKINVDEDIQKAQALPEGANVPALGLSNKAIFDNDEKSTTTSTIEDNPMTVDGLYKEGFFKAITLNEPPFEEHLLQNTLWPEIQKLYGHGYEIIAVASNPSGSIIASSCKASHQNDAAIILWNTNTWKIIVRLAVHQLTVVRMVFSNDGRYLLSVSRDRSWSLFEIDETNFQARLYKRISSNNPYHKRIIWTCHISHDDKYFATGARDQMIHIWRVNEKSNDDNEQPCEKNYLKLNDSVTAVTFAPRFVENDKYFVVAGLDNGSVFLYTWNEKVSWQHLTSITHPLGFHLTVNQLCFRPSTSSSSSTSYQLAGCSNDGTARIFSILLS